MSAREHLNKIQFQHHQPTESSHQITAYNEHGESVGWLRWSGPEGGTFTKPHEITALGVSKEYQRQGIASEMYRQAKDISPIEHSSKRTWQGERFAKSTGDKVPRKADAKYLKPMAPPPVGYEDRIRRQI